MFDFSTLYLYANIPQHNLKSVRRELISLILNSFRQLIGIRIGSNPTQQPSFVSL